MVTRWVFTDPVTAETYTVPRNPRAMGSPFPERTFNVRAVSALTGTPIVSEGTTQPATWQFEGSIVDHAHYMALHRWVYVITNRIVITDHFGRDIDCLLQKYDPVPRRAVNKYWRHDYKITGLVFAVGEASVGI